jgi:hypothetical protein
MLILKPIESSNDSKGGSTCGIHDIHLTVRSSIHLNNETIFKYSGKRRRETRYCRLYHMDHIDDIGAKLRLLHQSKH